MIKLSGKVYLKFKGSSINMGGEMGQNKTLGCITAADRVYVSLGTAGTYPGYGPVYRNVPW